MLRSNSTKRYDFVKQKLLDYKTLGTIKSSEFPTAAISKIVYPYLLNDIGDVQVINCDKYEFWLYQQIERLKRISPAAWAHINIYGRYEFNKGFLNLEFNELIKLVSIDSIEIDGN